MTLTTTLLRGQQLHYRIDNISILRGVEIEVRPGELVGLIGPNGAGKSTLLKVLAGLLAPERGDVWYGDRPLSHRSAEFLAREIGYLAQQARACWPITVQKLVELGRIPHQRWWAECSADDLRCVEHAMQLTETLAYRNRIVTTLSGGEHTLVMLARIFATAPRLLFADEPVAALDPYHQLHVMEILREHARSERAAVVVLHDLSLAARFCDRLYLLHHGELHCQGSPQEVLTDKHLATVYGVKATVSCGETGVSVTPVARIQDHHP